MPPPTNFPFHQADEVWVKTEQYLDSFTIPQDEALEFALKNADANGLPRIAVSASQGKLLSLLAKSTKTKRVLEIGTLAGYVVPCLPFRRPVGWLISKRKVLHNLARAWFTRRRQDRHA